MFQEFPKSLYMGGDISSEHVIVKDAEQEAQKRELGFRMAYEQEAETEPAKRKYTRRTDK